MAPVSKPLKPLSPSEAFETILRVVKLLDAAGHPESETIALLSQWAEGEATETLREKLISLGLPQLEVALAMQAFADLATSRDLRNRETQSFGAASSPITSG